MSRCLEGATAAALLALMALLLVLSSRHKRLSNDETYNLDYGRAFLAEGPGAPLSPHLPSLALNALFCFREGCLKSRLDEDGALRMRVRSPTIAITLLQGALLFLWARQILGGGPALLALALYVFNPNFLAHGKEVTGDVATSLACLLAAWGALLLARGRLVTGALLLGAGFASAALTKQTSLVLVPLLGATLLLGPRIGRGRRLLAFALALALALLLVNLAYGFSGCLSLARDLPLQSHLLASLGRLPLPILLPRPWVLGFDFLLVFQEQPGLQRGLNYALGHLSRAPLWYAFPLMFLLKTPLGFLGLLGLGLSRGRLPGGSTPMVLVPAAGILGLYGIFVGPQMGVRYLLPAFPFLSVAAARALGSGRRAWIPPALALWTAVSTLSYHPFYMSYFNELIGRRRNAYRFLADSNLDWEDRAYFIEAFRREHPEIPFVVDPPLPTTGYILVSANKLVGILDPAPYRWLRRSYRPIGEVGYSYLLFYVPPEPGDPRGISR
jgi:hypothetical protein